jgi:hypothetical protein
MTVVHGTQGKSFPWRSALPYQLNVPQPTTCIYNYQPSDSLPSTFQGQVRAIKSPAAFEGSAVDLVIDTLLRWPSEVVDYYLSCTSLQVLQPGKTGGAPNIRPSPDARSPDNFEWIKRKRHSAHTAAGMFLARWQGDDGNQYDDYAQRPYRPHSIADNLGYQHPTSRRRLQWSQQCQRGPEPASSTFELGTVLRQCFLPTRPRY